MASDKEGVQGIFRREVPRAIYAPCKSHKLNLVIASAAKLPQIRNCIAAINSVFLFLNKSHKRQGFFEKVLDIVHAKDAEDEVYHTKQRKVKGLCKTRWVERFEAFDNISDLLPVVIISCDIIVNPHLYSEDSDLSSLIEENWNWDKETRQGSSNIGKL